MASEEIKIEDWLRQNDLHQYIMTFISNNINISELFKLNNDNDINSFAKSMGIIKYNDINLFNIAIKKLNNTSINNNNNNIYNNNINNNNNNIIPNISNIQNDIISNKMSNVVNYYQRNSSILDYFNKQNIIELLMWIFKIIIIYFFLYNPIKTLIILIILIGIINFIIPCIKSGLFLR